jgi:ketosteroid isomerase-like protein
MATVDDLDQVIEQYQRAANEFLKGNPEPHKMMFSHREDATLLNPFGSLDHGFEQVAERMERFASQVSDGEVTSFDVLEKCVTPELAYVVWVERSKAKSGGRQEVLPFDLRVTLILRPEEGTWKVVHRHADSMTMARPIESVIQE